MTGHKRGSPRKPSITGYCLILDTTITVSNVTGSRLTGRSNAMKLTTLILPSALIAALALFAPHAGAQTMGEYATVTAGVASGGGSMGSSISVPSISNDGGGGSSTWSANGLGASFDDRAGAASPFAAGGNFDSRAGSGSRFPESRFTDSSNRFGDSASRFGDSSNRFSDHDRFPERSELSSSDRFNDNRMGLDTNYNRNELDASHSTGGLDNSYNPN